MTDISLSEMLVEKLKISMLTPFVVSKKIAFLRLQAVMTIIIICLQPWLSLTPQSKKNCYECT
ncbi:hypothetical protein KLQU111869_20170 [Klebsiella quasipneumoniae subsp. similipneumoniae]